MVLNWIGELSLTDELSDGVENSKLMFNSLWGDERRGTVYGSWENSRRRA
jgi:hypothetical protein